MQISDISKFKYKLSGKVKFEDVDSFSVVHNIKYLYWLEWARTEYMQNLLFKDYKGNFLLEFPVMVVRNELEYINSLLFNQNYHILSRVDYIKNSSFGFENIIINDNNEPIVIAKNVMVHIDLKTKQKKEIPAEIKKIICDYEGLEY